jgi:imidazolonepropionase-like amidohydrolase
MRVRIRRFDSNKGWALLLALFLPGGAGVLAGHAAQARRPAPQAADWAGPPVEQSVILVRGDRIVAVGRKGELSVPEKARVLDAWGKTVLPGLIDMHVHLQDEGHTDLHYPGSLYRRGRTKEVMARNARTLLMSGVTTARDVGARSRKFSRPATASTRENWWDVVSS